MCRTAWQKIQVDILHCTLEAEFLFLWEIKPLGDWKRLMHDMDPIINMIHIYIYLHNSRPLFAQQWRSIPLPSEYIIFSHHGVDVNSAVKAPNLRHPQPTAECQESQLCSQFRFLLMCRRREQVITQALGSQLLSETDMPENLQLCLQPGPDSVAVGIQGMNPHLGDQIFLCLSNKYIEM